MRGLGWTEAELISRLKNDSGKLAMAARVSKETTLPIKWIAARLQMGTSKSLKLMLLHWPHAHQNANASARLRAVTTLLWISWEVMNGVIGLASLGVKPADGICNQRGFAAQPALQRPTRPEDVVTGEHAAEL